MNRRRIRRQNAVEAGKNSFCASPPSPPALEERQIIKNAIDESLSAVHFNAQDMRSVLRAAHSGKKRTSPKKKRRGFRPDLLFAFSLVMMIALPVSLYAMRSRSDITTIATEPGETTAQPAATQQPDEDIISSLPAVSPTAAPSSEADEVIAYGIGESEAIRIARGCFETHCDTSIFTFEEYEVSVTLSDGESPQYSVTMESIYKNGCLFTVVVSAEDGAILQYSTPRLATVPTYISSDSPEVRAWYDRYGEHLFTWPQDVQAEFSRRYQGGTLRAAREDEISYETALAAVRDPVMSEAPGLLNAFYPVLYSERASTNGRAYYVVYCYAQEITDALPEGEMMTVSFDAATGDILSVEGNPLEQSLAIETIINTK